MNFDKLGWCKSLGPNFELIWTYATEPISTYWAELSTKLADQRHLKQMYLIWWSKITDNPCNIPKFQNKLKVFNSFTHTNKLYIYVQKFIHKNIKLKCACLLDQHSNGWSTRKYSSVHKWRQSVTTHGIVRLTYHMESTPWVTVPTRKRTRRVTNCIKIYRMATKPSAP